MTSRLRWPIVAIAAAAAVFVGSMILGVFTGSTWGRSALGALLVTFLLCSVSVLVSASSRIFLSGTFAAQHRDMTRTRAALREDRNAIQRSIQGVVEQNKRIDQIATSVRGSVTVSRVAVAHLLPRDTYSGNGLPRVLFVTSNGGGMGHLARCAAVIRAGVSLFDAHILTLSTAHELAGSGLLQVRYFPSKDSQGLSQARWNEAFADHLVKEITSGGYECVVFDGTWIYDPIREVTAALGVPLIWLRRGLWRESADLTQVRRTNDLVDGLVVPSDVGGVGAEGQATDAACVVAPVSSALDAFRMDRGDAAQVLGIAPDRRYALVQLAGGNARSHELEAEVLERILDHDADVTPVVVNSPLRKMVPVPPGAVVIAPRFPLADFSELWEYTVTRAGYNSVHENLHTGTPGMYVPSLSTLTDNQALRAASIAERGLGVSAADESHLEDSLTRILDAGTRASIRNEIERSSIGNGAHAAAYLIRAQLVDNARFGRNPDPAAHGDRPVDEVRAIP